MKTHFHTKGYAPTLAKFENEIQDNREMAC